MHWFCTFCGIDTLIILQVRQTAVSYDGSTVLAACEDGTIHRWDLVQAGQQSTQQVNLDEP